MVSEEAYISPFAARCDHLSRQAYLAEVCVFTDFQRRFLSSPGDLFQYFFLTDKSCSWIFANSSATATEAQCILQILSTCSVVYSFLLYSWLLHIWLVFSSSAFFSLHQKTFFFLICSIFLKCLMCFAVSLIQLYLYWNCVAKTGHSRKTRLLLLWVELKVYLTYSLYAC